MLAGYVLLREEMEETFGFPLYPYIDHYIDPSGIAALTLFQGPRSNFWIGGGECLAFQGRGGGPEL